MQDSKAKSKSRAIVIPEDEQIPFVRMQGDSIVLTGAKDGRHPLVVTLVDVYSRYSWQRAIETNAQGKFSQEASAKFEKDFSKIQINFFRNQNHKSKKSCGPQESFRGKFFRKVVKKFCHSHSHFSFSFLILILIIF
jgi:hypothetical protein